MTAIGQRLRPPAALARVADFAFAVVCLAAPARAESPVTALAFSPDGAALASGGSRGVDVRSPADASVTRRIPCGLAKITSLAFHPRGKLLAVAGGAPAVSGELLVLAWPGGEVVHRFAELEDIGTVAAFSPDGVLVGVASADHSARVWRVRDEPGALEAALTLKGHSGPVLSMAFSPTGLSVVTGGADGSIKVWSAASGELLRGFHHHGAAVHALTFRPASGAGPGGGPVSCASASEDRTVRVWQPEIGRMVRIVRGHAGPVFSVAFAPGGAVLFSAGKEGVVRAIDASSDKILAEWTAHADWTYALAVSPDGLRLASGDWSGDVRVWDLREKLRGLEKARE